MRQVFMLNDKANNEKNLELESKLLECIDGLNSSIEKTTSLEELKEILNFYKNKVDIIYAVGGDGTVNTILNGIYGGTASLGIIPVGTGNDFYRKLNEYREEAIDVNVMKVNNRFGINSFSIGIDAEIGINADLMKKLNVPSNLVYVASMLYTFCRYKNKELEINGELKRITLLALCNGTYYGGGFAISPVADIRDKKLCGYLLNEVNKLQEIYFLFQLLKGHHEDNSHLDFLATSDKIKLISKEPLIGQLDGELMEDSDFLITPSVGTIKVVNNKQLIKKIV